MDIDHIRREYLLGGLRRDNLLDNPFQQFELWLGQAVDSGIPDPTAMTIATVDAEGQPDQRLVLLKQHDERGMVFYTNYRSRKAQDIAANPKVSLHFPWHVMERQVRVNGVAQKLTSAESLKYFLTRPRESQLAAWASRQSTSIRSRSFLLQEFDDIRRKFEQGDVPLPDFWGGYRVVPHRFEFWQGGASRLHDRFEYLRRADGTWSIGRLAP